MTSLGKPAQLPGQTKIKELESIRGMAALLVVLYHYSQWGDLVDCGVVNNSYLMVDLFFVLSGFVIFNAYSGRIITPRDLIRFQFLRFGRLYPVHLLFLLSWLAIEVARYIAQTQIGIDNIHSAPFRENSAKAFFQHLLLIQAIGPTGNDLTFNGPSWSISVEFFTYLAFGILILYFRRFSVLMITIVATISLILIATGTTNGFGLLIRCFAGFFLGCLTARIVSTSKANLPGYWSLLIFLLIIIYLQVKPVGSFDIAIYFLAVALIMTLVLSPKGVLNGVLQHKVLNWLGLISYAVYMSHTFVLFLVSNFYKRVLGRVEIEGNDGIWRVDLSTSEEVFALFLILVLVLIISHLTFKIVEKPMRLKSRQYAFSQL